MANYNDVVRKIFGKLNMEVVPTVKENSQCVQDLINKIRASLPQVTGEESEIYHLSFLHCGSAYEGLSIDLDTDFDITVTLEGPFKSENFKICHDRSEYFTLEWKPDVTNKMCSDSDGYVVAAKIRQDMFSILQHALSKVQIPNAKIEWSEGFAALKIILKYNTGRCISIDLVPQIVFRTWGQVPHLRPLEELPRSLRCYIDTLKKNKSPVMCFNLAAYKALNLPNYGQLFAASFSMLEKKFICSNVSVRDMVRMVKLVAKQREWKANFKFHSYFAKTIAIKYFNELEDKDEWEGYKTLLYYLHKEVGNGKIDGYYITEDFHVGSWNPLKAVDFQNEIVNAMKLDPRDIDKLL